MARARSAHLGVDRARHDVPGREVRQRVVPGHERAAGVVPQHRPLAADRLADQEGARLHRMEGRRVELDELQVGDRGPGAERHRDPVAGGDPGIGGVPVDLPAATRRKERHARRHGHLLTGLPVHRERAEAARASVPVRNPQVEREVVLVDRDARPRRRVEKAALDRPAGQVVRADDAPGRVTAFAGQRQAARAIALVRETDSVLDELAHPLGAAPDQELDRLEVAESRARLERVRDMRVEGIAGVHDDSDTALRVVGVGLRILLLGEDGHAAVSCRLDRVGEPGNPAPEDQDVGLDQGRGLRHVGHAIASAISRRRRSGSRGSSRRLRTPAAASPNQPASHLMASFSVMTNAAPGWEARRRAMSRAE